MTDLAQAQKVLGLLPLDAPMHLEELLKFFREFVDRCHHGKEEEILFPALATGGDEQTGALVGVLGAEHEEGRRHAQALSTTLRAHIDREDHTLFPKARILLPAAQASRLVQQFEVIERERMGPGVHEAFHALLHRLRVAYPG